MVLYHRKDGTLIDADIIVVHPAEALRHAPVSGTS